MKPSDLPGHVAEVHTRICHQKTGTVQDNEERGKARFHPEMDKLTLQASTTYLNWTRWKQRERRLGEVGGWGEGGVGG